jgi:uncharacterized repeat protein (TIGR03803 family)
MHGRSRPLRFLFALAITSLLAGVSARAEYPEVLLKSFGLYSGEEPISGVVTDANGVLYGTTSNGGPLSSKQRGPCCGVIYQLSPPAGGSSHWDFTVVADISQIPNPLGPLIISSASAVYKVSPSGGNGLGGLFGLTPQAGQAGWTYTLIHNFSVTAPADGQNPTAVVLGADGNLYGVSHGDGNECQPDYRYDNCGVFYSVAPPFTQYDPTFKILAYFLAPCDTACAPANDIAPTDLVTDGTYFYGVTSYGNGQVVRMDPPTKKNPAWSKTIIYKHAAAANHGASLDPDLVFGPDGALYLTANGGTNQYGQVLQLAPTQYVSWQRPVVYGAAGFTPNGVAFDAAGNIYGAENAAAGPVWRLKPFTAGDGSTRYSFSALYSFKGGTTDGANPNPGLIVGIDGNLYGATNKGGANNQGAVYKVRLH